MLRHCPFARLRIGSTGKVSRLSDKTSTVVSKVILPGITALTGTTGFVTLRWS
jgi:hypothetical protein